MIFQLQRVLTKYSFDDGYLFEYSLKVNTYFIKALNV